MATKRDLAAEAERIVDNLDPLPEWSADAELWTYMRDHNLFARWAARKHAQELEAREKAKAAPSERNGRNDYMKGRGPGFGD